MRTFAISVLALTLSSTFALASTPWWTLRFAQGLHCTGTATGVTTGPGEVNPKTVCVPVPDFGFTGAVDWSVAPSSKRSFSLGLHKSSDCGGDGGKYVGGIKAVSVTRHTKKRSVTGRRAAEALFDEHQEGDEEVTLESTDLQQLSDPSPGTEAGDLEKRKNSCFAPSFALGADVAAGMFIYNAVDSCPATAKDDNVHRGKCGVSATFSVAVTLITIYSVQGLIRHGDQSKRAIDLPYNDTTIVDGFSISYTRVDEGSASHPIPSGSDWSHYRVDHHDLNGKHANGTTIHSVHESGRQRLTSLVEEGDDETGIVARRSPGVAYYSWVDGKVDKFKKLPVCKGTNAAENLAEQLWNYIKQNNRNEVCASLRANGIPLNHGDYALIRGTYTDQAGLC